MARTKTVVLRLSEEEYNLLKELSGREPMNAYLRRVALGWRELAEQIAQRAVLEHIQSKETPAQRERRGGVEGAQGIASESRPAKDSESEADAPSPPEPQWKPAKPIPAEAFDWFKCPVSGCSYRSHSNKAICPQHARRTSIMV